MASLKEIRRCIDGPGRNNPRDYLERRPKPETRRVVVCLGDSLTQGDVSGNYVDLLAARLGPESVVVNAGVNGRLAWSLLGAPLDEVVACAPRAVTVLIGTNDVVAATGPKETRHYTRQWKLPRVPDLDWYRENLTEVVEQLKRRTEAKVAVLSPPPIGESPTEPVTQLLARYVDAAREVAAKSQVFYLPLHEKLVELQAKAPQRSPPFRKLRWVMNTTVARRLLFGTAYDALAQRNGFQFHSDHLHLSDRGAGVVAELIEQFIRSAAG